MGTKPKKKKAMRSVKTGVKTAELIKQNQEILNKLKNDISN